MLAVITGGSRGLGAAFVQALLARGDTVVAAARGVAPVDHARLHWRSVDLSDPALAGSWIEEALSGLPPFARASLILNAGMIDPLGPVSALSADALETHFRLNLTGPMLSTAAFLRATEDWGADRRVMGISSGAGRRGVPHWSAYCAAKAGLDGFIRALASESDVRAVSMAPGLVDTAMQEVVRTVDTPTRSRFQDAHATGGLASPDSVAARLVAYLDSEAFGARTLDDIRELEPPQA
ncbi:SDR family NAD(P)-dependent oxidoreductase [Acetobacteraceae bacterium KSS8]|uniref:SDR family NAD(P)-dependent oxidoreductase n=1 Tax=Endosaccharibacter trunci TaxID=2812733 RepID=A0ABT1W5I2_9PROT|nr:SDR family NAD(P)-dependent oxidoreductase [Acetobacteraceae bacterium KSS8]